MSVNVALVISLVIQRWADTLLSAGEGEKRQTGVSAMCLSRALGVQGLA